TGHEIALLTVESLHGEPIERFALEVGRAWAIGGKGKNDGAILVVSKQDRMIRIEVGRGLEGSLPDIVCGRIIRNVITPEFRRGRFGEGLGEGVVAIQDAIGGKLGRIPAAPVVAFGLAGFVCPFLAFGLIVLLLIRSIRYASRSGRRRPGGWFIPGPFSTFGGFGGSGGGGGFSGGGFSGFGGGGGFSGGGAS